MSHEYDKTIAHHYKVYRPPLHKIILEKAINIDAKYKNGLDIGCGTGYSSVALADYCDYVIGVDPSQEMIDQAINHRLVSYYLGSGDCLPDGIDKIDIVCFAGSLFYTKSPKLIGELKRVCKDNCLIIVYDFMVILDELLKELHIFPPMTDETYNHEINFDDCNGFIGMSGNIAQILLKINPSELAHVLMSDSKRYNLFVERFQATDPYPFLVKKLEASNIPLEIKVNTYLYVYQMIKY